MSHPHRGHKRKSLIFWNKKALVKRAEAILNEWPQRLAMIPEVKPLAANWLPRTSPNTGKVGDEEWGGRWWSWSPEAPTCLTDATCEKRLPDRFPYRNFAAYKAYTTSMWAFEDMEILAHAYQTVGDERYAVAVAKLLSEGSKHFVKYPLHYDKDADSGKLTPHPERLLGKCYLIRVGVGWTDTTSLLRWLDAYAMVKDCPAVTAGMDRAVQRLARSILSYNSLVNLLYVNDKYHNSLTNYYDAFMRTALVWGQGITVKDPISGQQYTGGDLGQLTVNGPKGVRMFIANAFDRNGVYWELSPSYTGYVLGYLADILPLLKGYSDPEGYMPGPAVRDFYRPMKNFNVAKELSDLWHGVVAQLRLAMNNGNYVPTDDTDYMNHFSARRLKKWAQLLCSNQLRDAASFLGSTRHYRQRGMASWEGHSTLMPAAGVATLRGANHRMDLHMDWHAMQDYHSHKDPLNMVICAEGYTTLTDLGYHLNHPLRHIISDRTAAHNTVTVDTEDAVRHGLGTLHHFIGEGDVQMIEASVPDAYPQCDMYRRTAVLVDDRYVLDIFRVAGGRTHDYALLSRADATKASLRLTRPAPGTVARPEKKYTGYIKLDDRLLNAPEPYTVMHSPRFGAASKPFTAEWLQRDRPDLAMRAHVFPASDGAKIIVAKAPHQDRRAGNHVRTDEILIVRREGQDYLESTFVSVMETLSEKYAPLESVTRLDVESSDAMAVAVEIEHEKGTDIIISAVADGPHVIRSRHVTLRGQFAVVRRPKQGRTRITMLSGILEVGRHRVEGRTGQTSQVVRINARRGTVTVRKSFGRPSDIVGRFVIVRDRTGRDQRWRIQSVSENGRVLKLDKDHSRLITFQGVVEKVDSFGYFMSGVNLCSPPAPGTPLRIGPVGDFRCPRYHVAVATQTGLANRVTGVTTALEKRKYQIGLSLPADLTDDDVGKPFWSSGIEVDDYVTTEPITRVALGTS